MKYDKLVRDKIPEVIKKDNQTPHTHIADDWEYRQRLQDKLTEESQELFNGDNVSEELADVQEVIDAIIAFKGLNKKDIYNIQQEKRKKRGWFGGRIVLDEVS